MTRANNLLAYHLPESLSGTKNTDRLQPIRVPSARSSHPSGRESLAQGCIWGASGWHAL
jgi:hypothetical protein